MLRIVITLYIIFVWQLSHGFAQPVITVKKEKETINIGRQIAVLQDSSQSLSFKQISSEAFESRFVLSKQEIPNFGSSTLPVWCRFKIKNYSDQKLVLTVNNTEIERLDLFIQKQNTYLHKSLSAYRPFNQREILRNKNFFLLDIPKDSTQLYYLRLQTQTGLQFPLIVSTLQSLTESEHSITILYGMYIGIMVIMMLYNLFIYFTIRDASYIFYVLYVAFMALTNAIEKGLAFEFLWPSTPVLNHYVNITACLTGIFAVLFSISFLQISKYAKVILLLFYGIIFSYLISIAVILFKERFIGMIMTETVSVITTLTLLATGIIVYRKGYKPAGYYLIAWTTLLIGVIIFVFKDFDIVPYNNFTVNAMSIGSAIEAMLLSLALANRIRIYKEEKEKAQSEALISLEENRKLITEQNILLERKVENRTHELKQANEELTATLQSLKETQAQLIQREKLASLGELTAGIAHEIQNPLNFVNNFSEVSIELADELKEEAKKLPTQYLNKEDFENIIDDLIQNQQKINYHGRRADSIVKGMLQHSRNGSGQKEPTDINVLVDECMRLSYHGLRAKDKTFNAELITNFDSTLQKVKVMPQDMGRVFLNLFNNAFYAVKEKAKTNGDHYHPKVTVSTMAKNGKAEVRIRDNGIGIPQDIIEKIYQPFFTTKPAGQGTGLGLSLSYDIITKGHGGSLSVTTQAGEFTEFIILLPLHE